MVWKKSCNRYEGFWEKGKMTGIGKMVMKNGEVKEGAFGFGMPLLSDKDGEN